jgi:glycosyltransferase involved in cell wall biosynthesis
VPTPSDRKHILYVAWAFVPLRATGTANSVAAVNSLIERGHRVTVLTADTDVADLILGADWSEANRVNPAARIVRVRQYAGALDTVISRWTAEQIANPERGHRLIREAVEGLFPEPVNNGWYPAWVAPATATASALHRQDPFDLVIANILPAAGAGVALGMTESAGLPLMLVERDSWVFNTFTGRPYDDAAATRPVLEAVMDRAVQIWYINQPLADLHRREFPAWADKIRAVPNGWDAANLPDQPPVTQPPVTHPPLTQPPSHPAQQDSHPSSLTFRYVGTIYRDLPLDLVADAWRQARAVSPLLAASVLELSGPVKQWFQPDPADGIILTGPVPKNQLAELYARTDGLLFVLPEGPMVTSAKVYEYAASGLPVISSLPPGHAARAVLAGRPLWFDAAQHSAAGLAGAFVAAAAHRPTASEAATARAMAEPFKREHLLARAFDDLEETLGW